MRSDAATQRSPGRDRQKPGRRANLSPTTDNRLLTTDYRFLFAVQILLEEHLAPILILGRRLLVGYPYRRIPLTQGKFARVDPEDYPALVRHKWCAAKQGRSWYAVRTEGNRQLRMHRVIMNAPSGVVVDHIDHDGLNNVPCNLRKCTASQNARNQRPQEGRSSQYIGVTWLKQEQKWWARIQKDGRQQSLGLYDDEVEAAKVRDAAAIAQHGEFASLNFPRQLRSRIHRMICRIRWPRQKRRRHRRGDLLNDSPSPGDLESCDSRQSLSTRELK